MFLRAASIALEIAERHFTCLAVTEADLAVAVADDGQCGEAELTSALDDLGNAIDRDQLFLQAVGGLRLFIAGHVSST